MDAQNKVTEWDFLSFKRLLLWSILGLLPVSLPVWSSESAVRAAFVFNFIKFIDWPLAAENPSFHLCVVDPSIENRTALDLLHGREVKKQMIDVIYLGDKASIRREIANCQMVYRPLRASSAELPHPLPVGVVLVADEPTDLDLDVSIGLVRLADDHLNFVVNQVPLLRSGVKVSSQMLKLSKVVRGGKD